MNEGLQCFESGWCDLSSEHRRVRVELERVVEEALNGSGYRLPIIVAPYGSGKTMLLRHLGWYCSKRLGVPVVHVELKELVDYIVEKYGIVHESDLPRVVAEFFRERAGSEKGVLLIDEVEESYDVLRGIVEHETSPLRGLAEAAYSGSIGIVVVLAFGPSSAFKEAIFGPAAWRSRVFGLPLVSPGSVFTRIRGIVGDDTLARLVANMVWWAGKARVAWVNLLVENVVEELVGHLRRGDVEEYLLSSAILGREVVEGAPIFDRSGYREVRRALGEASYLAPLLAILVGPVPARLLERLAGRLEGVEAGVGIVYTRLGVRVEELVKAFEAWLTRTARSRGLGSDAVEQAVYVLSLVLDAWSLNGVVPYDLQSLRELVSIAADLAREVYLDNAAVQDLIEALRVDIVGPEPIRLDEPIIALRPSLVVRVYPLLAASPLVGCARRAGVAQIRGFIDGLSYGEIVEFSSRIASMLGVGELAERAGFTRVLFLPKPLLTKYAREVVCEAIDEPIVVFSDDTVHEAIRFLELAGRVLVVELGEKPSLFVSSVLYSESLGIESCSLEKMQSVDQRAVSMYSELLKTSLLNKLASRPETLAAYIERLKASVGSLGKAGVVLFALAIAARGDERALSLLSGFEQAVTEYVAAASKALGIVAPPVPTLSQAYREIASAYMELEQKGLGVMLSMLRECGKQDEITRLFTQQVELGDNGVVKQVDSLIAIVDSVRGKLATISSTVPTLVEELHSSAKKIKEYYEQLAGYGEPGRAVASLIAAGIPVLTERLTATLSKLNTTVDKLAELLSEARNYGINSDDYSLIERTVADALASDTSIEQAAERLRKTVDAVASIVEQLKTLKNLEEQREKIRSELLALLDSLITSGFGSHGVVEGMVEGEP